MKKKLCGCGCKTPLQPRKDGSFANYAPGGHDAKHKSALVKAAMAGDTQAETILAEKGWTKFLEAKRTKTKKEAASKTGRVAVPKKVSTIIEATLYGMSEYLIGLLKYPPTEGTWICKETDNFQHGGAGDLRCGTNKPCWFCGAQAHDDVEFVWPRFEEAIEALESVPWEDVEVDSKVQVNYKDAGSINMHMNALKMLRLKERYTGVNTD